MDLHDDDQGFLRDLVKGSRQKMHHVAWTDRDGTGRQTALTQPEAVRLNTLAHRLGISKAELLRQAAFLPVAKPAVKPPVA
ncbi:MAG: ribbon-helix-helix domain-containing protein [Opitutales bacterium]|nr:ribbon-helix-helix domain-containing protein [Opitutales bacterium]